MKKVFITIVAIWMLLTAMSGTANAAEADTTVIGNVWKIDAEMEVHKEASESSEVITVLEIETAVLVTDDTNENWCAITVGDITGYIKKGHLVPLSDSEEINLEFEQVGNNYHMIFNEVQQLEKQRLQARIWGTVIAVLIVGIFAAGIIPVIRKNRENGKNKAKSQRMQ